MRREKSVGRVRNAPAANNAIASVVAMITCTYCSARGAARRKRYNPNAANTAAHSSRIRGSRRT